MLQTLNVMNGQLALEPINPLHILAYRKTPALHPFLPLSAVIASFAWNAESIDQASGKSSCDNSRNLYFITFPLAVIG